MILDLTIGAPDPREAQGRFERIADACADAGIDLGAILGPREIDPGGTDWADFNKPEKRAAGLARNVRSVLVLVCQRAPYLVNLITRDPGRITRVAGDSYLRREKPREVMAQELSRHLASSVGTSGDDDELARGLRNYRADEMVRLGVRELALGNRTEVGRELAHLAEVCFDAAIAFHDQVLRDRYGPPRYTDESGGEHDAELVVIGMGKLGGLELNFTSDVDVIYIYTSDAGSAGDLSLHEYFSKLCKRITAAIGDFTSDDVVFRVDLRLRPEGSQGTIANSLLSVERYYETWGKPWERQAWLKARPCAGSIALGTEVLRTLRPFVYPHITAPTIIDEVSDLNRRIKADLDKARVDAGYDVKNGVGGIREVEFFTQALQLIHSGQNPFLRPRNTLVALSRLFFVGLISASEHRVLSEAYRYLRRVEHLLQLDSGRQTQRLPTRAETLDLFARRLGHADTDDFLATLTRHTKEVAHLFATLGEPESEPPDEIIALVAGTQDKEREMAILGGLGFADPAQAHHVLTVTRRSVLSPLGPHATGAAARVAPGLMAEIARSPDPDQALCYTSDLISRRGIWSSMWPLFDDNPAIMRRLVLLFGTSSFLAKRFVTHPELVDVLVDLGRVQPTRTIDELRAELDTAMGNVEPADQEETWKRLAEFKNTQILRIGLADIGGELQPDEVSAELTRLADLCLDYAYHLVKRAMIARHGTPREAGSGAPAAMAIMALGKLGSGELGYASDLDLIFVYSTDGESDGERPLDNLIYMTRLAQRLMSGLHAMHPSGRLYEVDTRLRPSGSKGLLVSTMAAWKRYHRTDAGLWERQALIKLRPVAGDVAFGQEVAAAAVEFLCGRARGQANGASAAEIAARITAMRDRIERELAGQHSAIDLKAGRGGLIDAEFASQYVQLVYGHDHPDLRSRSTVDSLAKAARLGLIDGDDSALLIDGYRFLQRIENRMRIVHDRSVHMLPQDHRELDKLARRAGYPDGASLTADYEHWTGEVRAAYTRILSTSAGLDS